jgi:predicted transcriptional regulator
MAEDISDTSNLLELAAELTMAWLSNPNTRAPADEVPAFLQAMHSAVANLAAPPSSPDEVPASREFTPATTARRSLASKDHIISMIDGKPYKTLKRHLSTNGLTPAEYRERYGLKPDYPMVAENYAAMRRGLAKKIGLGRKPGTKVAAKPAAKIAAKPKVTRVAKTGSAGGTLKS